MGDSPKKNSNNIIVINRMENSIINLKNNLGVLILDELEQGHTTLSHECSSQTETEYLKQPLEVSER